MPRKRILTHYEILGLKESCSSQDIRESFVTLSKKYHPDKNSLDSSLHEKFVKINDAYSILSKNTLRRSYDLDLRAARAIEINHRMSTNNYYNTQNEPDPSSFMWRDESIWPNQNNRNQKSYDSDTYYGIKGISRKPNTWIAAGACVFLVIGAMLHYLALKHSRTFSIAKLNRTDQILSEHLQKTRQSAEINGNDHQLEMLLQQLQSQQNHKELPKP